MLWGFSGVNLLKKLLKGIIDSTCSFTEICRAALNVCKLIMCLWMHQIRIAYNVFYGYEKKALNLATNPEWRTLTHPFQINRDIWPDYPFFNKRTKFLALWIPPKHLKPMLECPCPISAQFEFASIQLYQFNI